MTPLPLAAAAVEYPPLSALNDLLFCSRRCFLHRVEGVWVENAHTLTGSRDHQRVHRPKDSDAIAGRSSRGLRLVSHTLKVHGVADLVEWQDGVPFPVEYKRGKRRKWDNDDVQLCAQAICLEEMLGVMIPAGAIFHVKTKRRRMVSFTPILRDQTHTAARRLQELLNRTTAPPPVLHAKCKQCSLHSICLPELLTNPNAYEHEARSLYTIPMT